MYFKTSIFLGALLACMATHAEKGLKMADLTANGAVQQTKADLESLLPGAKVKSIATNTGSSRFWTHGADGTMTASSDNRSQGAGRPPSTGHGTWRIREDGAYCVKLEWKNSTEDWCRTIFRLGDDYYGVSGKQNPEAPAHELGFSK